MIIEKDMKGGNILQYTVEVMMRSYSDDAINLSKQLGKNLDFSEESIRIVDEILEMYHSSIPRGFITKLIKKTPSEEKISQVAKIWGGYIGEVIRKNVGGIWSIEENTIILTIRDTQIFPPAKAYMRIKNGSEENVWHYYQVLKQDFI